MFQSETNKLIPVFHNRWCSAAGITSSLPAGGKPGTKHNLSVSADRLKIPNAHEKGLCEPEFHDDQVWMFVCAVRFELKAAWYKITETLPQLDKKALTLLRIAKFGN